METPLPAKSFQQSLEGGRDQGSEHWCRWPFPANAFPPWHLLGAGTALLHQQARLSCHLHCVQRGTGAKFQPGSGERLALLGLGAWCWWSSSLLTLQLAAPKRGAACSGGRGVKMVCVRAQSCCSLRALGALANLSSPAEQGNKTEGTEKSCDRVRRVTALICSSFSPLHLLAVGSVFPSALLRAAINCNQIWSCQMQVKMSHCSSNLFF